MRSIEHYLDVATKMKVDVEVQNHALFDMTPERLTALREREQRDAAHIVGVTDVSFLGFPDGMLEPSLDVRRAITACIRRCKPDVVICQSPTRDFSLGLFVQHPDHLATGEATLASIYPCARDRMTFPELLAQGLEPFDAASSGVYLHGRAGLNVSALLGDAAKSFVKRRLGKERGASWLGPDQLDFVLGAWLLAALERSPLAWDVIRISPPRQAARRVLAVSG